MIKPGFSLIEFLIASFISALLSAALFSVIFQINRVVNRVDNVCEIYTNAALIHDQMQRDISGAFVPQQGQLPDEKEKAQPQAQQKEGAQQAASGAAEKKNKQKLTKVFYGAGADQNLELTFITSNPLQVYWSADVGGARPRVARVTYYLVADKERKDMFSLMRQESYDLQAPFGAKVEGKVRAYTLAEHIKEIKVEYVLRKEKKSEDGKASQAPANKESAPKEYEYVVLKEWNIEKESDDENAKLAKKAGVPYSVRISYTIWDLRQQRSEQFSCIVPILGDSTPIQKMSAQQTQQKSPEPSVTDRLGLTSKLPNKNNPQTAANKSRGNKWVIHRGAA